MLSITVRPEVRGTGIAELGYQAWVCFHGYIPGISWGVCILDTQVNSAGGVSAVTGSSLGGGSGAVNNHLGHLSQ